MWKTWLHVRKSNGSSKSFHKEVSRHSGGPLSSASRHCHKALADLTRRTIPYMYFDCLLKPIPQYATTCRDSWSKRHTSGLQDLQVCDRNMVVSSKTSSALCRRIDKVQVGWRAKTAGQNDSGTFSQSSWSVSVRAKGTPIVKEFSLFGKMSCNLASVGAQTRK